MNKLGIPKAALKCLWVGAGFSAFLVGIDWQLGLAFPHWTSQAGYLIAKVAAYAFGLGCYLKYVVNCLSQARETPPAAPCAKDTQEQAAEPKQREQSELLEKLNEAQQLALVGSWEWDLRTQRVWWSDETYRIFGVVPRSYVPNYEENASFVHPEDLPRYRESFERCFKTGEPLALDLRIRTSEGQLKHAQARGRIVRDAAGQPARFIGTLLDITERKRAEEALRESEARFRELAETLEDVFWVANSGHLAFQYVSPAYEKIWGRPRPELLADSQIWMQSIHPEDREHIQQIRQSWLAAGKYDEVYRILRPDGQCRLIRERIYPVRGEAGQILRLIGVARDITEWRQLEMQLRQAQKLEAVGQLAGGVAHDFNNILAAMMMHLGDLQQESPADSPLQSALNELMEHAQRAAGLTRQLLVFSRRSVLETKVLDFNDLIGNLLRMLGRLIGEHIQLHFERHPGLPGVEVDPGMMEQVLLNLCVNARDAMPQGGDLTIGLEAVEVAQAPVPVPPGFQPGSHVRLSVRDTGCGMDEATLHRIFEPFFTTKPIGQGTGLGLATVHGIVGQHHGWIEVDSRLGQGSTFHVYFPVSTKKTAAAAAAVAATVAPGRETILLVEDDHALRSITVKNLRRLGYQVVEAANGQEALTLARANSAPMDLLITDLVMPRNLSGVDVVRRIREFKPGQKAIIVSGYTSDIEGLQKLPAPDIHFLRKPYSTEELVKSIRQCLQGA